LKLQLFLLNFELLLLLLLLMVLFFDKMTEIFYFNTEGGKLIIN
jgi:hypothetical protein